MVRKSISLLILVCLVFIYSPSWAGCVKNNLQGTWYAFSVGGDDRGDHGISRGTIKIRSTGSVVSGTTFVNERCESSKVHSGTFKITTSCRITGHLTLTGGGDRWTVDLYGAMDSDKDTISGAYKERGARDCGTFTLIKQ